MSDRLHPVDEAIRRAFPDIEPSDEARQKAKDRLLAAIEAEKARESRRRRWPVEAVAAAITVSGHWIKDRRRRRRRGTASLPLLPDRHRFLW